MKLPLDSECLESQPVSRFFARRIQAFAVFLPENTDGDAVCMRQLAIYDSAVQKKLLHTGAPALSAHNRTTAFLTLENAGALSANLLNDSFLKKYPFRLAALTWNGENRFGSGCEKNRPLTPAGLAAIPLFERHGCCIDVSHLSEKGFEQVAERAKHPLVASHSNAKSICAHARNLSDAQLQRIFQSGGLVGLNLHAPFLSAQKADTRAAAAEQVLAHLSHMLSMGGEHHVAFGCDFDGGSPVFGLRCAKDLAFLYAAVLQYFKSEAFADHLFFENAAAFFARLK